MPALGRTVEISMDDSALDAAFQVYNSSNVAQGSCGSVVGGAGTDLSLSLAAGSYYIAIRGRNGWDDDKAFKLSVRDAAIYNSLYCSTGVGTPANITQTLQPGTYWIGLTGSTTGTQSGAYKITFDDTSVSAGTDAIQKYCGTGTYDLAAAAGNTYYAIVKGAALANKGAYGLTVTDVGSVANMICGATTADKTVPDSFVWFDVPTGGRPIRLDMAGSALDAVWQVYSGADVYEGCGTTTGGPITLTLGARPDWFAEDTLNQAALRAAASCARRVALDPWRRVA